MAWKLTIGGTDRTTYVRQPDGVSWTYTLNNLGKADFRLLSGVSPSKGDEVVVYAQDGTTAIWGGVITKRSLAGAIPQSTIAWMDVECSDWSVYADWCYFTKTYSTSVTLEDAINDVVTAKLGAFGITYTPVSYGVSVLPFEVTNMRVSDFLRELSKKTGYVFRWNPNKSLIALLSDSAPYTFTNGATNCTSISWTDSPVVSATKVILTCGPPGVALMVQTWVADGAATSWVTDFPSAGTMPGYVVVNGANKSLSGTLAAKAWGFFAVAGTVNFSNNNTVTLGATTYTFKTALTPAANEVLIGATNVASLDHLNSAIIADGNTSVYGVGTVANASAISYWTRDTWLAFQAKTAGSAGNSIVASAVGPYDVFHEGGIVRGYLWGGSDAAAAQYSWNDATSTLSVATDPTPSVGDIIVLTYSARFPFVATAGTGSIEFLASDETITTLAGGQEKAQAILDEVNQTAKEITIDTLLHGWKVAQQITIDLSTMITATALITQVAARLVSDTYWEYTLLAIGPSNQGLYLDRWRSLLNTRGGSSTVSNTSSGGVSSGGVTVVEGGGSTFLGGSRDLSAAPNPKAWTAIPEWVPFKGIAAATARVTCWVWARSSGVTVSSRVTSGTNGSTFGTVEATMADVTSQSPTERIATISLVVGRYYRLEVYPSVDGGGCKCVGYLESY